MTRCAPAAVVAAHGVVHVALTGFPHRTEVLGGTADPGEIGVRKHILEVAS